MTLIEHLEELRARIFKSIVAIAVGAVAAWFLYDHILALMVSPLKKLPVAEQLISRGKLIFTSPPEAFFIRLKIVSFAGLVLALPVILWEVWRFVAPGLYAQEKRYALPFVGSSLALFAGGVALSLISLPKALEFLTAFAGTDLVLVPKASEYLSFILLMIVAFGVAFEFPLALLALTLVGVLSSAKLRQGRKIAWILVLVVAAVITPTQDPITMTILAVPMALLYEATIVATRLLKR
ncbi:MAG: twin-arginine translocase subunit TatC [Actinomycetota bacterium]